MKKKDPCINCEWNTDLGCSCPSDEEILQCYIYRSNHPEELEQFDKDTEQWCKSMLSQMKDS